ncbi:hypothetical protein FR943_10460 [Mycobacterium sp. TNTM28]|uniref:Uncharacterized protein n=1 Tax=[Mycobacterium] fortunisiensis TaxID=2600579 RepID=A0ABS6KKX4_9MYCO|nr:hypothetical protein [[Mycobacterium] fortunisiensis]MBU9764262.1 hypothetical protein [[Mycobacterium] fortunisiensis]
MTAPRLDTAPRCSVTLDESPSWWDPDSECTIVVARPAAEPDLWREYVRGAQANYRKHGVQRALDSKALRTGTDTALFCVGINRSGHVAGGLRAKGPHHGVEESHALVEWSGQPGLDSVRKMIADRLPFGVVEMKTAWVCDDPEQSRALTDTLARMPLHAMTLLDIQFAMASAAAYVLKRWLSSGGVLATKIPATPYPDERYRTKMMWWDRRTFANHAHPGQLSRYLVEAQRIAPRSAVTDGPLTPTAAVR